MERCAHWAPCFWLISPKWLTFQAKDMHIREWNNKVLGKSAIKKGVIFQEADPLRRLVRLSSKVSLGDHQHLRTLIPWMVI